MSIQAAPTAPAPSPAAAPAPAPASAPKPTVDPLVEGIASAFRKIVTPEGAIKNNDKPVELATPEIRKAPVVVGEIVAAEAAKEKAEKEKAKTAEPPKTEPAPAPAAATPEPEKKVVVKPATAKVEPAPEPAPVAPAQQPAPAPAPADPDAEFVSTLNDAQREELEIARFAEKNHPDLKGRVKETIDYFKKLDAFIKENPNPSEEDQNEFIANNKPKYTETQRRKIERQMIAEEASANAKREMEAKFEAQEQEVRALKLKPVVEAAAQDFRKGLEAIDLPEGIEAPIREVAAKLNKDGYEAAAGEFDIEAPIVKSHADIAERYIAISRGAEKYDPSNPEHQWLNSFVTNQSNKLAGKPEAKVNGRVFLSPAEYAAKHAADPKGTARAHWTFSEKQILNLIGINAALQVNNELQKAKKIAESMGRRGKKSDKVENQPAPTNLPKEEIQSPKAGATPSPGPASSTAPRSSAADFINNLVPGAAERIGVK